MYIPTLPRFRLAALPSLIDCFGAKKTVVHTLVAQSNSGCAEAALATMLSAKSIFVSRLHTVIISTVSLSYYGSKSMVDGLTRCTFREPGIHYIDLSPLQVFPGLKQLLLSKGNLLP